jgi:hypothetical protein
MRRIIKPLRLTKYLLVTTPLRSDWRTLSVILTRKEMLSDNYGSLSK